MCFLIDDEYGSTTGTLFFYWLILTFVFIKKSDFLFSSLQLQQRKNNKAFSLKSSY